MDLSRRKSLEMHRDRALAVMFSIYPQGTLFSNNVPHEILRFLRASNNPFSAELFPVIPSNERYGHNSYITQEFDFASSRGYFVESVDKEFYRVCERTYCTAERGRKIFSPEEIQFLQGIGGKLRALHASC